MLPEEELPKVMSPSIDEDDVWFQILKRVPYPGCGHFLTRWIHRVSRLHRWKSRRQLKSLTVWRLLVVHVCHKVANILLMFCRIYSCVLNIHMCWIFLCWIFINVGLKAWHLVLNLSISWTPTQRFKIVQSFSTYCRFIWCLLLGAITPTILEVLDIFYGHKTSIFLSETV